jgi:hypothetical protein
MPGFDNDIIAGDGIDLSGDFPVENQLDQDGKLLIGSTFNNPSGSIPSSSDSALDVVVGDGTLDFRIGTGLINTFLQQSSNLSDVDDAAAARANLGISPTGITWNVITGTSQTLAAGNGYIANHAVSVIDFSLPATASEGDMFKIVGRGAGLWQITQGAGQTIYYGDQTTTVGVGGSLDAILARDSIEMICVNANLDFQILNSQGNLTVV